MINILLGGYSQKNEDLKTELMHYGVLGMKWGVRRTKEELRHNRSSISAAINNRAKKGYAH